MDEKVELVLNGYEFKRVLKNHFDTINKKYSLKKVDIEVLLYLSQYNESNRPTDIFKMLKINRGYISQSIDTLIKMGYIAPLPDHEDRRITHYNITEDAKEIISELSALKRDFYIRLFEGFSEEEKKMYTSLTYRMIKNLESM